jgi:hypothetical protein
MLSRSGRVRLALMLCTLALAFEPASVSHAQSDELSPPSSRARRAKKRRKTRSASPPPSDPVPVGPALPAWEETEEVSGDPGAASTVPVRTAPVAPPPPANTAPASPPPETAPAVRAEPESQGSFVSDPDEVSFSDPELEERAGTMADDRGWGGLVPETEASHQTASSAEEHDPLANTGLARVELIGQQGFDIRHEGDLEDAYETRLRLDAEVEFRRSRKLRMSIGLRTDLLWALPARGDPALYDPMTPEREARHYTPLQQDRWELDLLPLSAFVDTTLGSGFHVRLGEQPVSIRRMDFYSPIDILAAFDMRGQPKFDPTSGRLSQPAVRVDWDLGSWATLQMVYVPWFMPNLSRSNRDRYVATVLGTRGANSSRTVEDLVTPSFQSKVSETGLRFVGPAPDFTHPQAQTRLTMRGSSYELGLSVGTALEKTASVYLTPKAEAYAQGKPRADAAVALAFTAEQPVIDFAYHRYATFGIDGSLDLAPISLGFEFAYSPSRHLVAATHDGSHLPQPNVSEQIFDSSNTTVSNVRDKSIRKGVPLLQAALHMDWIDGERFALAIEGFVIKTTQLPYDKSRDWFGFIPDKGMYAGGLLGASYNPSPDSGRVRFDLSVISLVGPSLIVMPQVEVKAMDGLYVNLGAQIFEGPQRTPEQGTGGRQNVNVGGLFSGYDQVLIGFRYLP